MTLSYENGVFDVLNIFFCDIFLVMDDIDRENQE